MKTIVLVKKLKNCKVQQVYVSLFDTPNEAEQFCNITTMNVTNSKYTTIAEIVRQGEEIDV